jgi:hypothetical protein
MKYRFFARGVGLVYIVVVKGVYRLDSIVQIFSIFLMYEDKESVLTSGNVGEVLVYIVKRVKFANHITLCFYLTYEISVFCSGGRSGLHHG